MNPDALISPFRRSSSAIHLPSKDFSLIPSDFERFASAVGLIGYVDLGLRCRECCYRWRLARYVAMDFSYDGIFSLYFLANLGPSRRFLSYRSLHWVMSFEYNSQNCLFSGLRVAPTGYSLDSIRVS